MGQLSDTSVRVSWDGIDNVPELTGYRVYYTQTGRQVEEMSVTISARQTSVVFVELVIYVEYQFQVVALAKLRGREFVGNKLGADTVFSPISIVATTVMTIPTTAIGEKL